VIVDDSSGKSCRGENSLRGERLGLEDLNGRKSGSKFEWKSDWIFDLKFG
jgi:hypothetical protein